MTKLVTVLTATFNRADRLPRLYESLINQSDSFFIWMVIDDGSEDETNLLIEKWNIEGHLEIRYINQTNQGKHKAINKAMAYIDTTLVIIVDSDDLLTHDAIETIRDDWDTHINKNIIGLMYLKSSYTDELIGDEFLIDYEVTTYEKARWDERIRGDKAEVWFSNELRKTPFPEISDEKFFSEQFAYIAMSGVGKVLARNKIIYKCEYLSDGLSKRIRELQYRNPKGTVLNAIAISNSRYGFVRRIKSYVQIVAFSLVANQNIFSNLDSAKYSIIWVLLLPLGVLYYFQLEKKYGRESTKNSS